MNWLQRNGKHCNDVKCTIYILESSGDLVSRRTRSTENCADMAGWIFTAKVRCFPNIGYSYILVDHFCPFDRNQIGHECLVKVVTISNVSSTGQKRGCRKQENKHPCLQHKRTLKFKNYTKKLGYVFTSYKYVLICSTRKCLLNLC